MVLFYYISLVTCYMLHVIINRLHVIFFLSMSFLARRWPFSYSLFSFPAYIKYQFFHSGWILLRGFVFERYILRSKESWRGDSNPRPLAPWAEMMMVSYVLFYVLHSLWPTHVKIIFLSVFRSSEVVSSLKERTYFWPIELKILQSGEQKEFPRNCITVESGLQTFSLWLIQVHEGSS